MTLQAAVITGIGVMSPFGAGTEVFFEGLRLGRSGTRRLTLFEDLELESQVVAEVPDFDAVRYVDFKDLKRVPRVVPMALAAAREALVSSGLDPEKMDLAERRRMGVLVGTGGGGIDFAEKQYREFFEKHSKKVTPYSISSSLVGMLSSEISIGLSFHGISHVISTGCTSSTDALGYAASLIRLGQAEALLVGGAEACITHGLMAGFCRMGVVSTHFNDCPEKASRPFDKKRDGFVLGEGAWMFVVESELHARNRGARILAEIAGYGSTCDAYHRVAVKEDALEPARAMELALAESGTHASEVDCVQLHGTGTLMNDVVETRAIKRVFGANAAKISTTALKSMIGHPQGACGAAGVTAGIFSLREQWVPPTINLDEPDPECDLDYTPNQGVKKELRNVLCNTIAFGSKNSAILIRQPN